MAASRSPARRATPPTRRSPIRPTPFWRRARSRAAASPTIDDGERTRRPRRARHPDAPEHRRRGEADQDCSAMAAISARRSCRSASDQIWHGGQIVAVVLAETFEAAREAAHRLEVNYAEDTPAASFDSPGATTSPPRMRRRASKTRRSATPRRRLRRGAGHRSMPHYATPTQHHNPIELFTTTCAWADGKLTVVGSAARTSPASSTALAEQLGIDPDDDPCRLALYRRRLRLARVADPAHGADRGGRAAARPAGQAGRDPRAGLHDRHLPRRDAAPPASSAPTATASCWR